MSTKNSTKKLPITPKQCKAARDLLGWTQADLSKKSEIELGLEAVPSQILKYYCRR